MALVWVRLDAIDVALAEAAIGAGLTGALLMAALAQLQPRLAKAHGRDQSAKNKVEIDKLEIDKLETEPSLWLPRLASLLVAAGLGYTILSLPIDSVGLGSEVTAQLANSGVTNPVTAVLLNFRGYDTLLEIIVLLVALLGVWSLRGATALPGLATSPVLDTLVRVLVPLLILVAAYLLWVGAHAPGGAFQAGSVLGAAGVLLLLAGWQLHAGWMGLPLRLMLLAGPVVFVAVALFTLLLEHGLLQYPAQHAAALILLLEASATLSIGATLAALFLGGNPGSDQHHNKPENKVHE